MRKSNVGSTKHGRLLCCEDQRGQDHTKIVQDTMEDISFVTREVPIHGLFNVGQCAKPSIGMSALSSKGTNFSVMDYDIPELVVFIQEDHQQFVKDICVDRGVSPECKSLAENCKLDHNIISCFFNSNRKSSSNSNLQTTEMMPTKSNGSNCASKNDCRNLMEDEAEIDSRDKSPTDHPAKKTTSETLREVFRKEADISRSIKNWQINSFLGTIGGREDFPHCAHRMSEHEMGNSQSLLGSREKKQIIRKRLLHVA